MKDILIVHTPNKGIYTNYIGELCRKVNERFGDYYYGIYQNYDRLTIVGIPNAATKELSIGITFCTYPDNFNKKLGIVYATMRAGGEFNTKPYVVIQLDEFTQENCLVYMYDLHADLVSKSVKEVKKLVNQQIVK